MISFRFAQGCGNSSTSKLKSNTDIYQPSPTDSQKMWCLKRCGFSGEMPKASFIDQS